MVELNSSVNGCTASPTAPRDALGLFAVVLGAITTVAGVLLPWVTLFNGLSSVNGMGADGFYLLGIGTAALLLIALFLRTGRPAPLRRLALFLALVVTTVGLFDAWRIVHFSMAPGVLRPLAMPQVGPGSFVAATGGLLLAAGMLTLKPGASRLPAGTWPRLALERRSQSQPSDCRLYSSAVQPSPPAVAPRQRCRCPRRQRQPMSMGPPFKYSTRATSSADRAEATLRHRAAVARLESPQPRDLTGRA